MHTISAVWHVSEPLSCLLHLQVDHWKAGHKQECTRMAAEHAAEAASLD